MAVVSVKGGRPRFVADIDFSNDTELAFWDVFYNACAAFRYRDIMALSRALGVGARTVENWKYKLTFPRKGIAQQVIDWDSNGRPMKTVQPSRTPNDMF